MTGGSIRGREEGSEPRLDDPVFKDEAAARIALEAARWPNGPVCPHCAAVERIARIDGRSHRAGLLYCNSCKRQFTVTVGTACHGSKIPLNKWLLAMHLLSGDKPITVSALQRQAGVTYKTAWLMARRLRDDSDALYVQVARHARAGGRTGSADFAARHEDDRPNA